jgi:hypothetical protein
MLLTALRFLPVQRVRDRGPPAITFFMHTWYARGPSLACALLELTTLTNIFRLEKRLTTPRLCNGLPRRIFGLRPVVRVCNRQLYSLNGGPSARNEV